MTSDIISFINANAGATVKGDIIQRWDSRIVPQGLNRMGRIGAETYLSKYGRGMHAPKAIGLARISFQKGCYDLAARFWEEAFFLATGLRATVAVNANFIAV